MWLSFVLMCAAGLTSPAAGLRRPGRDATSSVAIDAIAVDVFRCGEARVTYTGKPLRLNSH